MEIILDGKYIIDKPTLFSTLKKQINLSEFYGDNLDALWDVLSSLQEDISIQIINQEILFHNLGEYAGMLLELFHDLKDVNDNVIIK